MLRLVLLLAILAFFAAFVSPREVSAHGWQESAEPLGSEDVAMVVSALDELASAAEDSGWTAGEELGGSLVAAVYTFAVEAKRLDTLPSLTERVLVTYEALASGAVTAKGVLATDGSAIEWFDILHTPDVPPVAAERGALDRIRSSLYGEGG